MEIECSPLFWVTAVGKVMNVCIDSFDCHVKFLDSSQFNMRVFLQLVHNEFGRIDLNIPECLESCNIDNVKHKRYTINYKPLIEKKPEQLSVENVNSPQINKNH